MKYKQDKSAASLRIALDAHSLNYIAAKLEMTAETLVFSLGYKSLRVYSTGPYKTNKLLVGPRALCLMYFVALYGYDIKELIFEADEAIHIKRATEITHFNYRATLTCLRALGVEPLTKDPIYIRKSDLALLMSPGLKHLRDIFNQNPFRLWRHGMKYSYREACAFMGNEIESKRLVQLESGIGPIIHEYEVGIIHKTMGPLVLLEYPDWLQKLRAARYELSSSP